MGLPTGNTFAGLGNPALSPPAGPVALASALDQNFSFCAATDLSNLASAAVLPVGYGGLGTQSAPSNGMIPIGKAGSYAPATLTAGTGINITNAAGAITIAATATVSSVNASGGTTGLGFSGGPITTTGILTLSGTLGYGYGGTGLAATPANGQLLIGNGSGYSLATLTAGSNVTITNSAGAITIAASGGGGGGSVTSVGVSGGTTGLTTSGGPVTTSGTITIGGTLSVTNGGTGATSLSGYLYGNGTGAITAGSTIAGSAITGNISGSASNVTGVVAVGNGGTGATNLTGYLYGNGTSAHTASTTIPGSAISGGISGTATNVSGTVAVGNGGTGLTSTPSNGQIDIGNGSGFTRATISGGTNVAVANGAGSISVGLTGTVAVPNGGTGATSLSGYLYGNGTGAITAGPTIAGSSITGNISGSASSVTGVVAVGNGGTGATSLTGLLKGNGTSAFTAAVAGTDYPGLTTANLWQGGTQTFDSNGSSFAVALFNAVELININATSGLSGTATLYAQYGSISLFTVASAANWTTNLAFSPGTTLASALPVGYATTFVLLATQGSTAYYQTGFQIDGSTSGFNIFWQGGSAPTAGNTAGIDAYTFTVIRPASGNMIVLASMTKF